MTTISSPSLAVAGRLLDRPRASVRPLAGSRSILWTLAAVGVGVIAVAIRATGMSATVASSDQAAMPWLLQHGFGIKWIFAHDYGPVLPLVERVWVELLRQVGARINEAAIRTPVMLASVLQVLATFGLLRRIGCSRGICLLGCLVASLLPTLVTDGHYCWGYCTCWLLTGTIALWATLAYLDEDRPVWLMLAGVSLVAHCLSNCFAFALPVTLLAAWWQRARSERVTKHLPRAWLVGFLLPCVVALAVIGLSYEWTGAGQIGRLLAKQRVGSTHLVFWQALHLPAMWSVQFGYLFGVFAAVGLLRGSILRDRVRLLAVWCWASLVPLLLFVDWDRVGYPASYLIEAAYAGGVLGAILIGVLYSRLKSRPARIAFALAAGLSVAHLGISSTDAVFRDGGLASLTGVRTGWGSIKPETGIKAVGWYVRKHVPLNAIVMPLHLNAGMEVPVAEYYLGRPVLAGYDLRPEMIAPLVESMRPNTDVLILEPRWDGLVSTLPEFRRVATFRTAGEPVRYIYARASLDLPTVDEEAASLTAAYDRDVRVVRLPEVLPMPPRFEEHLQRYQQFVRELRAKQ